MWEVTAYDTDYGFKKTWTFDNYEAAQRWCDALNFDYGAGSAYVERKQEGR